ncbi:MAG: Retinoic acid induced 16-like protein-domain-containing protein [Linnemannia gamsii]|nr:MAG: Retinoic acid induced 16-like protein-domain-containing protein [Linnemannia gamsii]
MDSSFWNKLKKTIMTAPKAQPSSAMQVNRFNKCWTVVQNGFSTPEKRSLFVQQTEIPMRLKNMVDLLVDEESRLDDASGTTGVCMEYLLKNNVLQKLVNNAEGDEPKGIMGETIRTIAGMINLLDDRFLVHNAVHKPTVKLLRTCASGAEFDGESYHEDLVDLMYILCSKIHGYPELLNIFFHDKQWLTVPQRQDSATQESISSDAPNRDDSTILQTPPQPKSDYEFLLFSYLSRFVHLEGKAGDFARTGLLFLMELATGSLGEYIMELGFTSFLSAGVGASYSQLPRKLLVRGGPNNINSMVGTLNDRAPPAETMQSKRANIEVSTSPDFQSRLDAFLKLLEFCQDIMMRCPNSDIVAALLVSFKSVFLENILYPSILECSDTDGSSVAVISYIDLILQVLEHEALVDLVVGFLMASDDEQSTAKAPADTDDAFAEVQNPQGTSAYFMASGRFTLKDLILSRLKSRSQPTVIATLKLLNTVITRHCKYSLKLLSILPDIKATSFRETPDQSNSTDAELTMINHHVHELDLFYALISTINPHNTAEIFCNGYESYLRDAEGTVETHQCFLQRKDRSETKPGQLSVLEQKKQRRRSMKYGQKMDLPDDLSGAAFIQEQEKTTEAMSALTCCDKSGSHPVPMHRLLPSDPLLQILLGTLSHFFAHSVELNLALTGVITSLAVCPYRSLEGWLLFKTSDAKNSAEEEAANLHSDVRFQLDDSDDEDSLPAYLVRGANAKSGKTSSPIPATNEDASEAPAFKSFPPFFTMLKTLTQQVDYYRSEIDGFDEYLADRRRGLLVATELNSAIHTPGLANDRRRPTQPQPQQYPQHNGGPLGPSLDADIDVSSPPSSPVIVYPPRGSSIVAGGASSPIPNPVLLRTMDTMLIKPLFADGFVNDSDSETEVETGRTTASGEMPSSGKREKTVTLGQLLTNVVILEEVVKEVVAVAQVRRGLGVDKVRFL